MDPFLKELVVIFGGNAILIGTVAWLLRSLLTHNLQKEIKQFETELKAKADTAIEQLRSALQIAAVEHQVRFSKLHEKRAEVIAELYKKLVQACWAGQSFVSWLQMEGGLTQEEKYVAAMNDLRTLWVFFEGHKIYLAEALCTSLGTFINDVRRPLIEFGTFVQIKNPTPETAQQHMDTWIRVGEIFDSKIPKAREALEREFRGILGVN